MTFIMAFDDGSRAIRKEFQNIKNAFQYMGLMSMMYRFRSVCIHEDKMTCIAKTKEYKYYAEADGTAVTKTE